MTLQSLLKELRNPQLLQEPRRSLLGPTALAHTKQLAQELPQLRKHVGPRPWFDWLERSDP
jgi:hypothetical protein